MSEAEPSGGAAKGTGKGAGAGVQDRPGGSDGPDGAGDAAAVIRIPATQERPGRASNIRSELAYIRGRGALEIAIIMVLVEITCIVWAKIDPTHFAYLTKANLAGVLTQSVPVLALLSIGVGILIMTGEFDLSVGANLGFSGIVFIHWYDGGHKILAFAVAIGTGIAIALLNGFIVTVFKIQSFVVTLGMGFFWDGAALFYNGASPALMTPGKTLTTLFTKDYGYFSGQIFWMLGVAFIFWFLVHRHKFGNHIYAVGGNAAAAKAISINPVRVKLICFAIMGGMAAFAGILIAIRTGSVVPGAGDPYALLAVAATVVGGTALSGGKGSVLGMMLGAVLIYTVQDMLQLAEAPGFYLQLFVGLVIVVAGVFNKLIEGKAS